MNIEDAIAEIKKGIALAQNSIDEGYDLLDSDYHDIDLIYDIHFEKGVKNGLMIALSILTGEPQ